MDATSQHNPLDTQESEQPMSIELMRRLLNEGATNVPELMRLMGLAESSVYRYAESTELRFGQLLRIFAFARSDRARELILAELLPGTGYTAIKLPVAADLDGDGDIDTDDALRCAAGVIAKASRALDMVINLDDSEYTDARRALKDAAERALAAVAIIDFVEAHAPKRRKARPLTLSRSAGPNLSAEVNRG